MQDAGEAYLVDPKFKEQFEIAHPTERYVELLEAVPAFFVGTEHRLVTLVELLCTEMSAAFQTTGIPQQGTHLQEQVSCSIVGCLRRTSGQLPVLHATC